MDIAAIVDPFFIHLYRITGHTLTDYYLGTFLLSLIAVIVGKGTFALLLRFNRAHMDRLRSQLDEKHKLSMAALEMKDDKAYRAINNQATDAYGRYYFSMAACAFAGLWPVPFVLAWMQSRFGDVVFQLPYPISWVLPSVGYFATFVPCYILARILFKHLFAGSRSFWRVQALQ